MAVAFGPSFTGSRNARRRGGAELRSCCVCGDVEVAVQHERVIYTRDDAHVCRTCAVREVRAADGVGPTLAGVPGCMWQAIGITSLAMALVVAAILAAAFLTDDVLYWLWQRGLWEVV